MKFFSSLFIIQVLLILNSSTGIAQSKSFNYQNFAFSQVTSDTIIINSEILEIPKVNVGDIGGQLIASPISGFIFAVLGGLGGYIIEPTSHDGPSLPVVIGALAGYTFGSAVGVYVVARKDKYTPNLGILIGGSLLGEITGLLLYRYSNNGSPNSNILAFAPLVLPPIFAIVTLNAFQQKKTNIAVGFDVQQLPQPNAYSYGIKLQYAF